MEGLTYGLDRGVTASRWVCKALVVEAHQAPDEYIGAILVAPHNDTPNSVA